MWNRDLLPFFWYPQTGLSRRKSSVGRSLTISPLELSNRESGEGVGEEVREGLTSILLISTERVVKKKIIWRKKSDNIPTRAIKQRERGGERERDLLPFFWYPQTGLSRRKSSGGRSLTISPLELSNRERGGGRGRERNLLPFFWYPQTGLSRRKSSVGRSLTISPLELSNRESGEGGRERGRGRETYLHSSDIHRQGCQEENHLEEEVWQYPH